MRTNLATVVTALPLTPGRRMLAWCVAHRWTIVVWAGTAIWASVLFVKVRSDHVGFRTARFDLGNMVQAVWSTAHGRPLEVTDASGEQIVRLASHVDPLLAALTPLWVVAPTPLSLAGAQIVAVGIGAIPLYWLGRRHLRSDAAAACVALAYLVYPWIAWTATDPLHPVTFAIPLLLFGVWFLDGDRLWAFAAVAIPAALTGELIGVTIGALGLWYAFARGRRRAGLAIATLGAGWTAVALTIVIPAFGRQSSPFYSHYEKVGGSPAGLVKTVFTDPGAIVSELTTRHDLLYPVLLGAPLVGAFLLAPALAAVAIPQLLANGLADRPATTDPRHHYVAAIVPFLLAATVVGLGRLGRGRAVRGAVGVLVVSAAFLVVAGPLSGRRGLSNVPDLPRAHVEALRDAAALVPDDVPVTSTNLVGAHLSARRYVYSVPILERAEWAVVDTWNPWVPSIDRVEALRPDLVRQFVERLEGSGDWTKVFERDGVLVFRKAGA